MSFASLEREILAEARTVFNNKKLRKADIMECTTDKIEPRDDEAIAELPTLNVSVAVLRQCDKRAKGVADA